MSTPQPFLRHSLDVLFVCLKSPSPTTQGVHYYSVTGHFWTRLYEAGLLVRRVDYHRADEIVFGGTMVNFNHWHYGITALVQQAPERAAADLCRASVADCRSLCDAIVAYAPRVVALMGGAVNDELASYLWVSRSRGHVCGYKGRLLENCAAEFYCLPLPTATIGHDRMSYHYGALKRLLLNGQVVTNGEKPKPLDNEATQLKLF